MNEEQIKMLREISADEKKILKYLLRSQRAITRNTKKLCVLKKQREAILYPSLPGLE